MDWSSSEAASSAAAHATALLSVWWTWLLVIAIPIALFCLWWVWWRLPKRQADRLRLTIRDPKARADIEDNIRKTIGQLLGGAAVLIGAALAYLQFTQQQQGSRDLLISNQVGKGFEQLGSERIVVRLGGIYALEGVMNTSEQYHQPVLEALSAFVRDGTRTGTGGEAPATDIQAALTVIARRRVIGQESPVLLSWSNIPRAFLVGANLRNANLMGANLTEAQLSIADLNNAFLLGANLTQATMGDANLHNAYLEDAQLDDADLRDAKLNGADLRDAKLNGADLTGAAVFQRQLDQACGEHVKGLNTHNPRLTIKPCPQGQK